MVRISGVDLPRQKQIEIALTYIYGIGLSRSKQILAKATVSPTTRCKDLSDQDIIQLRQVIDNDVEVEGDLRRSQTMNVKRLIEIGAVRGRRHHAGLPVRGQRTRTNSRTRRARKTSSPVKKK
jgi:small subunit ribosomal protein S13